ncbi:MAG: type II secretion system protein N [Burkholderiaceae bacterium]
MRLRWLWIGLAGLLAIAATALASAPARFIDLALDRGTLGRVRLAEAEGTLWRGAGRLVLVDTAAATAAGQAAGAAARSDRRIGRSATVLSGLAIPGRLRWAVKPWPLLAGLIDATVSVDGMADPVRLQGSFTELRVAPGALTLPSVELGRLGSPWNSIRPSGALALRWEALTVTDGQLHGRASIELRDAASVMTPVSPLGSYRVDIDSRGVQAQLAIETLAGPLQLAGTGNWTARGGLRFEALATAEASEARRLQSFLGLIGRREGGRTVIKIGA